MNRFCKTALIMGLAPILTPFSAFAPIQLQPINITGIVIAKNNATINFTGTAFGDPPSAYTLLGATTPNGTYSPLPAVIATNLSGPNQYEATVSITTPVQYFRIVR